jgi:RNA polymerase sigma-70 factor (ECF subfamily)
MKASQPARSESARIDAASEAMDRYAAGEDAAFADLYDAVAPRLEGYFLRRSRDAELAQDLLQQTLLQVHRARGSFIPGADVMPWLFSIARRLLIDNVRKTGRRLVSTEEVEVQLVDVETAPADDFVHARELVSQLNVAVADLPDPQRMAFALQRQEGLSLLEVAEVLNITVGAVKLRLHRAQQALRAALRRLEETP